ncbi:NADPH2:quinone reductase [Microlunatus sagamiharensis]|uniref:NADPH2:quinone reductase n=1 Tax=Microlunatus sagamiharensis TaxID=546874 RepID=A0A1H2LPI4_9ACTN|nr:NADPH:quinone reductase [Microlunatus sagamiharensis]SDU82917.1 NADPH2:quinone reductase [Microlunatus sagamiharensis]
MKSIVYRTTGDPSVLELVERPVPEPGPGEVRVNIAVSGVNPTDWKSRVGSKPGEDLPFAEVTPNQDGAGTVEAISPEAAELNPQLEVGDRVWIFLAQHQRPTGTAQEYVTVPVEHVVRLPDGISFDVGASLGVPAMTAHRALTVAEGGPTRLHPGALEGRTVLVAGGAGAVGHAAIQLARWAGATVVTTISSDEKAALATAAGAHHVVNYRTSDAAAEIQRVAPDGIDLVAEVAPGPNAQLDLAVLNNHGTIAVYANDGGESVTFDIIPFFARNLRFQGLLLYTVGEDALQVAAEDITAALVDGVLGVGEEHGLPLLRFPLEETAAAHEAVQSGAVGKVLIYVA